MDAQGVEDGVPPDCPGIDPVQLRDMGRDALAYGVMGAYPVAGSNAPNDRPRHPAETIPLDCSNAPVAVWVSGAQTHPGALALSGLVPTRQLTLLPFGADS